MSGSPGDMKVQYMSHLGPEKVMHCQTSAHTPSHGSVCKAAEHKDIHWTQIEQRCRPTPACLLAGGAALWDQSGLLGSPFLGQLRGPEAHPVADDRALGKAMKTRVAM